MLIELVMCHPKPHDYTANPLCVGHWWLTLSAADQGAWLSGAASFAAAGVAVFIALWADRRERRKQELARSGREIVLASYLFASLARVSGTLKACADELVARPSPEDWYITFNKMTEAVTKLEAFRPLPLEAHLEKLVDIPEGYGQRLAALPPLIDTLVFMMRSTCSDRRAGELAIQFFIERAAAVAAQMRQTHEMLEMFLARYHRKFVG